jgi:hypothetical protein
VIPANPAIVILAYNIFLFAFSCGVLLLWSKLSPRVSIATFLLSYAALVVVSVVGALITPIARFGRVQLVAWALFMHYPFFLLAGAYRFLPQRRRFALGCVAVAVVILLVCVDAFLIEPHWLEVSHVRLSTTNVETSLRVAVIADLQTDAPGRYERRVLERVDDEDPDLILFVGDYVDVGDPEWYGMMIERLNGMLREADLDAPFGPYAVPGNVDWPGRWQRIFAGLPVRTFERSATVDLGSFALTGLTLRDAADGNLSIDGADRFHIVVGHRPDFSLGEIDAELLVAGHTHGGQVRLPFIGPIVTLSGVPRAWASGVTEIEPGKTLVVSRGIGMERGNAPRMRFLCRPQLVILELVPADTGLGG